MLYILVGLQFDVHSPIYDMAGVEQSMVTVSIDSGQNLSGVLCLHSGDHQGHGHLNITVQRWHKVTSSSHAEK